MICPNCNEHNSDDAKICRKCKFKLNSEDYFDDIPYGEFCDFDFEEDGYIEPLKKTNEIKPKFIEKNEFYYMDDKYKKEITDKKKSQKEQREKVVKKKIILEKQTTKEEPLEKIEDVKNNEPKKKKVQPINNNPNKNINSSKKIIPIGIVLFCIVFAIGFFKGKNSSSDVSYNQEVYDSSYEENSNDYVQKDTNENNSSTRFIDDKFADFYESGTPIDVAFIDSSNVQKYLNYNYPIAFNTYFADGFSFGYPSNFYNRAEKLDYGYKFSADNGAFLYMTVTPCSIATDDLADEMDILYKKYDNMLYNSETIVYKYDESIGYTRFILSGFEGPDKATANYIFCNVKNDKIEFYHLRNILKGYSMEEGYHMNYILDTVYRMCSFSGTSYKPRTFTELMNNEMGEKK